MKCLYGSGQQEIEECKMIYIHWPGYYPTEEVYRNALKLLCPNYVDAAEGKDIRR
jgi:hypothetical protein